MTFERRHRVHVEAIQLEHVLPSGCPVEKRGPLPRSAYAGKVSPPVLPGARRGVVGIAATPNYPVSRPDRTKRTITPNFPMDSLTSNEKQPSALLTSAQAAACSYDCMLPPRVKTDRLSESAER